MPSSKITVDTGVYLRFDMKKRMLTALINGKKTLPKLSEKLEYNSVKPQRIQGDRKIVPAVGKCWTVAKVHNNRNKKTILALKPSGNWYVVETDQKNSNIKITRVEEVKLADAVRFMHNADPGIFDVEQWDNAVDDIATGTPLIANR